MKCVKCCIDSLSEGYLCYEGHLICAEDAMQKKCPLCRSKFLRKMIFHTKDVPRIEIKDVSSALSIKSKNSSLSVLPSFQEEELKLPPIKNSQLMTSSSGTPLLVDLSEEESSSKFDSSVHNYYEPQEKFEHEKKSSKHSIGTMMEKIIQSTPTTHKKESYEQQFDQSIKVINNNIKNKFCKTLFNKESEETRNDDQQFMNSAHGFFVSQNIEPVSDLHRTVPVQECVNDKGSPEKASVLFQNDNIVNSEAFMHDNCLQYFRILDETDRDHVPTELGNVTNICYNFIPPMFMYPVVGDTKEIGKTDKKDETKLYLEGNIINKVFENKFPGISKQLETIQADSQKSSHEAKNINKDFDMKDIERYINSLPPNLPKTEKKLMLNRIISQLLGDSSDSSTNSVLNSISTSHSTYPKHVSTLNISLEPIICPISTCKKYVFISEMSKHVQMCHKKAMLQVISPMQEKSYYWDPNADKKNVCKLQVMYLIKDRISDLGRNEFHNLLPILLMTTKFKVSSLLQSEEQSVLTENLKTKDSHFMLWLTGLCTKKLPIYYHMTLLSKPLQEPGQQIIFSGSIHSWRNEQTVQKLYNTGSVLILTRQQYQQMTRNGKDMIQINVQFL